MKANALKLFVCILFLASSLFAFSDDVKKEANELKYIFSLDTSFTMTALKNYGYGIGVNYEQKLTDFLSIKPGIGHMVCFSEITTVTVDLKLFFHYYPLNNGLDKLYVGFGSGCDFLMYQNNTPQDIGISLTPVIGWKWKVFKYLMVDPFIGWKFLIMETNNYEDSQKYLNGGFQWGINFQLYLSNEK